MKILLVNPLASAKYLSAALKELRIHATAIYTQPRESYDAYMMPDPSFFDKQVYCEASVQSVLDALSDAEHTYDFVLNGSERTVRLSDELAARLTPGRGNPLDSTLVRSDKDQAQRALSAAGLRSIRQVLAESNAESVRAALTDGGFAYPFFLKPLKGVGSKGAAMIASPQALEAYFDVDRMQKLRSDLSVLCDGDPVERLIVAEYIEGEEYFVDSFSLEGKHHISSIQRYRKVNTGGVPLYCYFEVVKEPHVLERIHAYLVNTLDALDYRNGFAHTELFLDANGPVLIELNPRIGGLRGATNLNAHKSGCATQPELLAAALSGKPVKSLLGSSAELRYSRALTLFGLNGQAFPDLKHALSSYRSISAIDQFCKPGQFKAARPASISDVMAVVICTGDSAELVERESAAILEQDMTGWSSTHQHA
jgi:biotin carboxylase